MSLVIVSPHLDDAVFSCGTLIAAASIHASVVVLTVCAGIPADPALLTQLDAAAGFETSAEAVRARRAEDEMAGWLLGFTPVHLNVLDGQHDQGDVLDRPALIDAALRSHLDGPFRGMRIVAPVGIRHPDHIAVAAACRPWARWTYEELPYRVLWPQACPSDLPAAAERTLPSCDLKAAAIECYRSQLGNGPAGPELSEDERYHLARR